MTAQLIHAASDTHLWAESYERDLADVLLLQGEVAHAIAGEIRVAVTAEEARHLTSRRRVDPEAYDDCLRGRFHWYKLSREHLETSLRYFERALEKDPGYARAWAGIAGTWASLTDAGFVAPHEAIPKARAAAQKALELERRTAASHVPAVRIARLWAHAGEAGRALDWLEKARAWRENPLVHLAVGWDWDACATSRASGRCSSG